uniref:Trafficking protein particle complex subunit 11 n=1 Tax=Meloidogyne javanica TaxID=6303 RepID=A0A915LDZ7_MELJA
MIDLREHCELLRPLIAVYTSHSEPSEHEFLRTYLACIFVVSTADSDPLNKLAELQAEQQWEQQNEGGNSTAKRISPAHCVSPKWFFPNVLKYYVLLHDNSLQDLDKQRYEEILKAVCERYGEKFCSFITLNSANPSDSTYTSMPDIWRLLVDPIQENLQTGLKLAKQNLYSSNDTKPGSQNNITNFLTRQQQPTYLPPVSSSPALSYDNEATTSVNPSLFTTNAEFSIGQINSTFLQKEHSSVVNNLPITKSPMTYAQITSGSTNSTTAFLPNCDKLTSKISSENIFDHDIEMTNKIYGQWLSVEDRLGLQKFVEEFVRDALAKTTFSSMKKWLQTATTNTNPTPIFNVQQLSQSQSSTNLPISVNISTESVEYQARRLADLAFLFGLYQYANQFYQSLKKEFASEQAWIHHIGCLEMAGISAFLHSWQQLSQQLINPTLRSVALANLRKLYPQRYLNNAINLYANVFRQPYLALRALMNSVIILTQLELYSEAAQQLILFNTLPELVDLSDLIGANVNFESQDNFVAILECLVRRDSSDPVCMDWINLLVDLRRVTTFVGLGMSDFVIHDCQNFADPFIKIGRFSHEVYPSNVDCIQVWNELIECAGKGVDAFLPNSPPTLFLNEYTNNNKQCYLPRNEPLVVRLRFNNPFPFSLLLRDLRLSICDVKFSSKHKNGDTHSDDDLFKLSNQDINLPGNSNEPLCFKMTEEDRSKESSDTEIIVDLQAIPNSEIVQSFRVEGIRFQLCVPFPTISSIIDNKDSENIASSSSTNSNVISNEGKLLSVFGFIPIKLRGPRLAMTKEQRRTKQYAADKRLEFFVQPTPSPLLAFHLSDENKHLIAISNSIQFDAYANQILQLVLEVKNIGQCSVERLVVCSNWPEQVSVSEPNLPTTSNSDNEQRSCWISAQFIPCRCPTFADQPYPASSEFEGTAFLAKFNCTKINKSNPLKVGHRTRLRIALRARHNIKMPADWSQLFYFLFLYSDGNNCRQFRFTIRIRTIERLFSSTFQLLNSNVGLYLLKLQNAVSQTLPFTNKRDENDVFQEEFNSLAINEANNKRWNELVELNGCTLMSLTNTVVFESNQSLSFCFFATPISRGFNETKTLNVWNNELWLTNQQEFLDIPVWNFPLSFIKEDQLEEHSEDSLKTQHERMLALKILWSATLVQSDKTSNMIFGESFLLSGAMTKDNETSGDCVTFLEKT